MNLKLITNLWYWFDGKKTYATAIATVLYAVFYYGLDQKDWGAAVSLILGASGLGALRHAQAKTE